MKDEKMSEKLLLKMMDLWIARSVEKMMERIDEYLKSFDSNDPQVIAKRREEHKKALDEWEGQT